MEAFTGPTELHPLRFGPRQTGVDPFPDDAALELYTPSIWNIALPAVVDVSSPCRCRNRSTSLS